MRIVVCSGFSPAGYEKYGKEFLRTFDKYWPKEVELLVYCEETVEVPRDGFMKLSDCRGVDEFIRRYQDEPEACGKKQTSRTVNWKPKDSLKGYSYKYDAVKFSRQCFIPEQAMLEAQLLDDDILVWLDADVMTFNKMPDRFIQTTVGQFDLCYLGRQNMHPEIGFWAVKIGQYTRKFLRTFANIYRSGDVFNFDEWHSAFIWDKCREGLAANLKIKNLTPKGSGHVWFQSPLAEFTDHLKGDFRKTRGKSLERS